MSMRTHLITLVLATISPLVPATACDGVAASYGTCGAASYVPSYSYAPAAPCMATAYAPVVQAAYILPIPTGVATTSAQTVQVQAAPSAQVEAPPAVTYAAPVQAAAPVYAQQTTTVLRATPSYNYAAPLVFANQGYRHRVSINNDLVDYGNQASLFRAAAFRNYRDDSLGEVLAAQRLRERRLEAATLPAERFGPVLQQKRQGGLIPSAGRAVFGRRIVGSGINNRGQLISPTRRNFARGIDF